MYKGRVVIPRVLRPEVLGAIHRAHQGTTGMALRAQDAVWWPSFGKDLQAVRDACMTCRQNAPSQPNMPSVPPPTPDYPMQMLASDYFTYAAKSYLVLVDRYSGWPVVRQCQHETSEELIAALREFFCTFGVPEQLASDGASVYLSSKTQAFLKTWGVRHRVSTAYNPHSNLRAETAVKSMKRLITQNVGPSGTLNTDAFAAALLTYRNTPDRDTKRSPSQVLYARKLRDTIPCKPTDLRLRPEWVLTREAREQALARRHQVRGAALDSSAHPLHPLTVGTVVQIQNQAGNSPNKWDKSGAVTEVLPFDAYLIRVDGSGRVTKRNRKFLRPIVPYSSVLGLPRPLSLHTRESQNSGTPTSCPKGLLTLDPTTPDDPNYLSNSHHSGIPAADRARTRQVPPPADSRGPSTPPASPCSHPVLPLQPAQHPVTPGAVLHPTLGASSPTQSQELYSSNDQPASSYDTDATQPRSADADYLPAGSSDPANYSANTPAQPHPNPQPASEPQLRRGTRVRFQPEPRGPSAPLLASPPCPPPDPNAKGGREVVDTPPKGFIPLPSSTSRHTYDVCRSPTSPP